MDRVFSFLLWPKREARGPWKQGRKKRGSITCHTDRANEANKMFIIWLCWLFRFWKGDREPEVRTATYGPGIDQSQHAKSVSHIIMEHIVCSNLMLHLDTHDNTYGPSACLLWNTALLRHWWLDLGHRLGPVNWRLSFCLRGTYGEDTVTKNIRGDQISVRFDGAHAAISLDTLVSYTAHTLSFTSMRTNFIRTFRIRFAPLLRTS